ncbi:cytochrome c oxidase accessory protein CcoG [Derxia lacustris]|uniref:cytochrome c oxidase accessory protein CcoG n=1 Tax=Derxia lacustris TaxID=764842 RepID=UPI000A177C86|nr:cytochrome c oxidase accessory protein CcoG [Derxia lacustris]
MSAPQTVIPIHPAPQRAPLPPEPGNDRVYAREVHGRHARLRWFMVWFTQALFYGLPWLGWAGRPALLFDLDARRFFLFGLVLQPQDMVWLAGLLVLCALGLFFVTAVAGRVWCGYSCPQTVYTEIFMWIERRIEGSRGARIRLDRSGPSLQWLARKGAKHAAWIGFSLWTGFTLVGYFTPIRELGGAVLTQSTGPWESFWLLFYGLATYANAGFLREQMCKHICPYGRFQGALLDPDSLVIAYDAARGEPRGARPKAQAATPGQSGHGACIDCSLCVQVCPTGIDIRNGLQTLCIGCAACIDACDSVMDKLGAPRGLVRYTTGNALAHGLDARAMLRRVLRPRVLVYGALLIGLSTAFVLSLANRPSLRVDVIRDRGVMARSIDDGASENVYRLVLMNSAERPRRLRIDVVGAAGLSVEEAEPVELAATADRSLPVHVRLAPAASQASAGATLPIVFEVHALDGDDPVVREPSTFIVPR